MRPLTVRVLKVLADGEFHSGEALGSALSKSRGSIWHAIRELEALGLDIYKVPGRGYRCARPLSLFDAARIKARLGPLASRFELEICASVDSTSTRAVERAAQGAPVGTVVVAESQSSGRGRLGRPWHAMVGGGLTFSLLWRFTRGAGALSGLSLAAGIAVARAVEGFGGSGIGLKWPNDVLWQGRKVAGILIELQGDALGPTTAVIGVGVNVRLSDSDRNRIDQPAEDLETICGAALDRNAVLARVLCELHDVLQRFGRDGFAPLRDEWQRRHAYQDRPVTLQLPGGGMTKGLARGATEDGRFVLETKTGIEHHHSGEITLRPAARIGHQE